MALSRRLVGAACVLYLVQQLRALRLLGKLLLSEPPLGVWPALQWHSSVQEVPLLRSGSSPLCFQWFLRIAMAL